MTENQKTKQNNQTKELLIKILLSLRNTIDSKIKCLRQEVFTSLPIKSLAPTNNADNGIYDNALYTALKDDSILNIGITGPYGSGKSSVIRSFEKKYSTQKNQFLNISLATFNEETKNKLSEITIEEDGDTSLYDNIQSQNKKELDQLIELSIIQQIFYHVKARRIPDSRFKRIRSLRRWQIGIISLLITIWFFSLLLIINPNINSESILCPILEWRANHITSFIFFIYFSFGLFLFTWKIIRKLNSIKLSKLNLVNGEIELGCQNEQSILNRYLDEIIYFFEINKKYNIVVFEDLDRLNNHQIFSKLREINNLLNNSEQIRIQNRKIKFIYALCDNHFKENKNRTKFFDVLIPVIPVINTTNSGDKINVRLKEIDQEHSISDYLIQDIQLYIDDMRLLFNISNEYLIYKEKIGTKLDKTQLFAMIVYKNIYPTDFADLHNSKGLVYKVLKSEKHKLIEKKVLELNDENKRLTNQLAVIENTITKNEDELIAIYVSALLKKIVNPTKVRIHQTDYYINELLNKNVFLLLMKNGIINYEKNGYQTISINIPFIEIENEVDSKRTYSQRLNELNIKMETKMEDLKKKIEDNKTVLSLLKGSTFKELASHQDISKIFKAFETPKYDLLSYLLRNGYINEDYQYYLSYFYSGSLTNNDHEFLMAVKNEIPLDFHYKLIQVQNVAVRIHDQEYSKPEALNIDLLDFLLIDEDYFKLQIRHILNQIKNKNQYGLDFLEAFIDSGEKVDILIKLLTNIWNEFWFFIEKESGYSFEKQCQYLILILQHAKLTDIKNQNKDNLIANFIANYNNLFELIPTDAYENTIDFIYDEGIIIPKLADPIINIQLFDAIYESHQYALTLENIEFIIRYKNPEIENLAHLLRTQNYTTIQNSTCDSLKENVSEILKGYIVNIYLQIETNTEESENNIVYLLNNNDLTPEIKQTIIERWNGQIGSIQDLDDESLWPFILEIIKVVPTWENVYHYWNREQVIDEKLTIYLNNSVIHQELANHQIKDFDDYDEDLINKLIEQIILCNEISYEAYKSLLNSIQLKYDKLDICDLSFDKVKLLIELDFLALTPQNYKYLKASHPNQQITLIECHEKDFFESYSDYTIDAEDELLLLKSDKIIIPNKIDLIKNQDEKLVIENPELAYWIIKQLEFEEIFDLPFTYLQKLFENCINQEMKLLYLIGLLESNYLNESQMVILIHLLNAPYSDFIKKDKKPIKIENNEFNLKFTYLLKEKGYISSCPVKKNSIVVYRFQK